MSTPERPPEPRGSLLLTSAAARATWALGLIVLLWAAVAWALAVGA